MLRRFQILIEGTVKSTPESSEDTKEAQLEEMKEAVQLSFKPDEQWGVSHDIFEVTLIEKEEGDSGT